MLFNGDPLLCQNANNKTGLGLGSRSTGLKFFFKNADKLNKAKKNE